jgi:hypothetical protein
MLLATFFVVCSAINKEILRKQYGESNLALHLNYPFVYSGMFCKFLWSGNTAGLVYGNNVISMNCMCCEVEYLWVSTRSWRSLIQIRKIFIRRNFYTNVVKCQENKKARNCDWCCGRGPQACYQIRVLESRCQCRLPEVDDAPFL